MAGGCWAGFGASGLAHLCFTVCPRAAPVRFGFGSSGLRLAYQSFLFKGAFFFEPEMDLNRKILSKQDFNE